MATTASPGTDPNRLWVVDQRNPVSRKNYEREIDAAVADDDIDLFDTDPGHPDDWDPLGDGLTLGESRWRIAAAMQRAEPDGETPVG